MLQRYCNSTESFCREGTDEWCIVFSTVFVQSVAKEKSPVDIGNCCIAFITPVVSSLGSKICQEKI